MAQAVLIIGESGTGKSASLRNFAKGEVTYFNVAGKPLPFKGRFLHEVVTDSYRKIKQGLKDMETDIAVIDDSQYLMVNEFMRRSDARGYDKFTEIAKNFWALVTMIASLPFNKRVYFLSHLDTDDNGRQKVKTIGKLLDEKITVEGLFTVVLKTKVQDGKYSFATQNNGNDTVKSPMGLFSANEIPNDLKAVDEAIVKFYELDTPIEDGDHRPSEAPVMAGVERGGCEGEIGFHGHEPECPGDEPTRGRPDPNGEVEPPKQEEPRRQRRVRRERE